MPWTSHPSFYVQKKGMRVCDRTQNFRFTCNSRRSSGVVIDYRNWHLALGRRFRSLKIWFVLRSYGAEGFRNHIRQVAVLQYDRIAADAMLLGNRAKQILCLAASLLIGFLACHRAFICVIRLQTYTPIYRVGCER